MLVNKYYFANIDELKMVVEDLSYKLESENEFDKKIKYLNELADVMEALIYKYNKDKMFVEYAINELKALKQQVNEVL